MKKILFLISLITIFIPIHAGNSYTIFRIKGEIKRSVISSDVWETISIRDTVKLSDKIIIPQGGSISILASETGIIYSCSKEGQTDVKHIIDLSKESLKSTLISSNKELFKTRTRNHGIKVNRVHGATSRGKNNNKYQREKKLAKRILKGDKQIKLNLVEETGYYRFRVNSKKTCRICIVCTNNNSVALCLPSEGVQVFKGETILKMPEVFPSTGTTYYIFNVKNTFDEAELCRQIADLNTD